MKRKILALMFLLVVFSVAATLWIFSSQINSFLWGKGTLLPTPSLKVEAELLRRPKITEGYITSQGNNLLVLVDKKISLGKDFVPADLVTLDNQVKVYRNGMLLRKETLTALKKMFEEASVEGVNLEVVSAYRSFQDQVDTFNGWVSSAGLESAETFSAQAGHSQHQLGTTVDLSNAQGPQFSYSFGQTKEGIWLAKNADKFGFVLSYPSGKEAITGYSYEPWHFRYIGVSSAEKMVEMGVTLEEFLQKSGTW